MFGLLSRYFEQGHSVLASIRAHATHQHWEDDESRYLEARSAWLSHQGRATRPAHRYSRIDQEDEYNFYYLLPRH